MSPLPADTTTQPVMLSIAGSDCSSGAGLQADLKAAAALGVYALTAVTCVVSEVPGKVSRIIEIDSDTIADQIRILLDHFPVAAVKTGMLYSPAIVETVADCLHGRGLPLVIDPVMIASSGDSLIHDETLHALRSRLIPLAGLITPNMDEALALGAPSPLSTPEELRRSARLLADDYKTAVLLKGGHLPGSQDRLDILALPERDEPYTFTSPYIPGVSTHGTGCTYSSAIAAGLASGLDLPEAVFRAHLYVAESIRTSLRWLNPRPLDALNHFHKLPPH